VQLEVYSCFGTLLLTLNMISDCFSPCKCHVIATDYSEAEK